AQDELPILGPLGAAGAQGFVIAPHGQNGIPAKYRSAATAHPVLSQETDVVGRRWVASPATPGEHTVVFIDAKEAGKAEGRGGSGQLQGRNLTLEILRQPDVV